MIRLRNVEKSIKQGAGQIFLLRRIDLEIPSGDFVTVMGPSGAGKSTLASTRRGATAPATPSTSPIPTSQAPWPMTIASTSRTCAPSAMRTPISCVLCSTM